MPNPIACRSNDDFGVPVILPVVTASFNGIGATSHDET